MIKLQIKKSDIDNINKQLNIKVQGIQELTKNDILNEIAKAAFVILGKRFMSATDSYSAVNRKKMHHVYEWNQVGSPSARLFVIERSAILNGSVSISSKFLLSKTPVPIAPELRSSSKNGKYIKTSHIFKQKADVMESGKLVSFEAKKTLAFLGKEGIHFVKAGKVINIVNPGGVAVKGSFQHFMASWYSKNAQSIMDSSGLYEKIVREAAIVLNKNNTGAIDVKRAVAQIVDSITMGEAVIR
jgi:hypothetical protein